jgi:hypothetical protein
MMIFLTTVYYNYINVIYSQFLYEQKDVKQSATASPCIRMVEGDNNCLRKRTRNNTILKTTDIYDNTHPAI